MDAANTLCLKSDSSPMLSVSSLTEVENPVTIQNNGSRLDDDDKEICSIQSWLNVTIALSTMDFFISTRVAYDLNK